MITEFLMFPKKIEEQKIEFSRAYTQRALHFDSQPLAIGEVCYSCGRILWNPSHAHYKIILASLHLLVEYDI